MTLGAGAARRLNDPPILPLDLVMVVVRRSLEFQMLHGERGLKHRLEDWRCAGEEQMGVI